MTIIFANNALSKLAQPLLSGQTTLTVQSGTGALFPSPSGGDYFKLTIEDRRTQQIEVTHCIGRAGDVLTIVRAQENMTAQDFLAGATVSNRFTRDTPEAILEEVPNPNPLYLGAFATAPTTDNDGNPLTTGMAYFNTGDTRLYFWTGATWIDPIGSAPLTSASGVFILQDPSTNFDGVTTQFDLRYTDYSASTETPDVVIAEQFIVWLDGVAQRPGTDYTIPVLGTIEFAVAPAADVTFHGVWVALTTGLPGSGTGDMTRAVYDTDNDGTVDAAESVSYSGIQLVPTARFLGRATAGTGPAEALTAAQLKTALGLTAADVGLGNVDNTSDATKNAAVATLTNKTIDLASNTVTGTTAQFNTALSDGNFATLAGTETLTGKTISLGSNTISGSLAEFNAALTGADFASLAGAETLTNKTFALGSNTFSGTTAQFNTALTDGDFATLAGTETLTGKTISLGSNTISGTLAQFNTAISDANIQPEDATLTALAAFNTNGLLTQTAADTFAGRTITGTSSIVVTNGNGVSGNPTIRVAAIPIGIACSDETTALTNGAAKATFRMPYAFTLTAVRASLTTAQTSGSIFTVDINEGGTTILSTKLTIDNTEKTSTTAATAAVISDTSLADDAEITVDIDQVGDGTAKGLKIWLIGYPT